MKHVPKKDAAKINNFCNAAISLRNFVLILSGLPHFNKDFILGDKLKKTISRIYTIPNLTFMRILIFLFLLGITFYSQAQIKSGSFQIDGDLNHINVSANANFEKFRTDLSLGYSISEDRINYYHAELNMEPADIYFSLELSRVAHRPVEEVIRVYKVKRANGWGEIARELGIKPGSAEFHALKNKVNHKSAKYKGSKNNKIKKENNGHGKSHGKGKK